MSVGMRGAWAAEAHIADHLRGLRPLVVPLAPSFPCDLLAVGEKGELLWVEVKSAKTRSRLRSNRPSPDERAFLFDRKAHGDGTAVVWVLRLPGGRFQMFWNDPPPRLVRRSRKVGEKERDFSGGRRSART